MAGRTRGATIPWRFAGLALALSLVVALGYLALRDAPVPAAIEGRTLAWRAALQRARPAPDAVVIAAIDDRTIAARQRWPLPRRDLAAAVDALAAAGASAIGVDLQFAEPEPPAGDGTPSGDPALADALRRSGRAVLALAFTFDPHDGAGAGAAAQAVAAEAAFRVVAGAATDGDHVLQATGMLVPIAALRGTAALGHVNMPDDSDGMLRAMPAALAFAGGYVPALPVTLAARHRGLAPEDLALRVDGALRIGPPGAASPGRAVELALDPRLRLPLRFYGPAGTVPGFSVADLLDGRVPAARIAGRTVLIGATALALGDQFVTPFGRMPGVEVLATATANLIAGDVLERAALRPADLAAIVALGLLAFALARRAPPAAAAALALGLAAAWFAAAQVAYDRGLWLDVTFPVAAILLNAALAAALRATMERRMRRNLARYHSPVIVGHLAERAAPAFEGRAQDAAILFVDIAGFTGRAEGMSPAETVPLLRAYHGRVERAVLAHGGVLERFMGDGALVIFGVPEPTPRDAAAALGCARDLVADIARWNRDLAAAGERPIDVSVGIHFGPVVMARLGGEAQAEITPTGDTVNVASRIEKLTRDHDAAIAISDAVADAIPEAERAALLAGFAPVAAQAIRGRVGRIGIRVLKRG